jgi:cytochrome c-type biogenesis protein CcmH/NrfF
MSLFINWIIYGITIWAIYLVMVISAFHVVDRYGQFRHMVFYISTVRTLLWVIPLSWLCYGIYLVLGI